MARQDRKPLFSEIPREPADLEKLFKNYLREHGQGAASNEQVAMMTKFVLQAWLDRFILAKTAPRLIKERPLLGTI